ncbi:hypothetical protein GILI108418_16430 [Gillisia limnaea]|uniref:Uncharacterized protein n=1 Tax=Gillisia limnaea (strain DSM 15749 / LMG 21470 / R-8282) TaxID=865937 RepID=H2BR14_GILLR|nr:hypothetical protein Gilli_0177 [Gillisia limnaea DSM 15749]
MEFKSAEGLYPPADFYFPESKYAKACLVRKMF